jgi:hypothetical protein
MLQIENLSAKIAAAHPSFEGWNDYSGEGAKSIQGLIDSLTHNHELNVALAAQTSRRGQESELNKLYIKSLEIDTIFETVVGIMNFQFAQPQEDIENFKLGLLDIQLDKIPSAVYKYYTQSVIANTKI